jgi:hypothetical protein
MSRLFDFISQRDGIILERDAAALVVGQQLVAAEAKLPGALAGHEHRRGGKVQSSAVSWRSRSRKTPPAAACALYIVGNCGVSINFTPGATSRLPAPPTHQIAGNAGLTHGGNQLVWIAGGKMDRTDDCVMTFDGPGKPGDVTSVGLQRGYAR